MKDLLITDDTIISQTISWIKTVVIDCNFCPFAAKAMLRKSVRYVVLRNAAKENALETLLLELQYLDQEESIETTLIILPDGFDQFRKYLGLVTQAEKIVSQNGYEGVYQIASFHPDYQFAGSTHDEAANYTNRSIYPMLHILREESISKVLEHYEDAHKIPENNIAFARQKGLVYMQALRLSCF